MVEEAVAARELEWGELLELPQETNELWKVAIKVMDPEFGAYSVHVTFREDGGELREVFVNVGTQGSTVQYLAASLARSWSKLLRLGLTPAGLASRLKGEHGPVCGETDYAPIPRVLSLEDLVGKLIEHRYLREVLGQ